MKYTKFQSMKQAAEVNAVFGKATFGNAKKQINLDSAIMRVESLTTEKVVNETLSYYKMYINQLPKDIRGNVKKAFCDAVRFAVTGFDLITFVDNNGNVNPKSVFNKVKKADAPELCQLITNLVLQDAGNGAAERIDKEYKINAACDTLAEILADYKIDVLKFLEAV